jgi:cytoskeleton protein RodZ
MTPELTQEQQSVETAGTPDATRSPGAQIRRARERAQLSPEEFAAQMKLARGTLEALERDDFKMLVEPVYVRGYYRKCAKLLGIAEKDLVDAYQALVAPRAPEAPAKLRLASGTELGSGSRLPVALSLAAAVVGVVVISLIWFARGETRRVPPAVAARAEALAPEPEASKPETAAAQPLTPAGGGTAESSATAAPAAATGSQAAVSPAVASAPVSTPPVAASPQSATSTPAAAVTSASITLRFTITSWARVDDAGGKTLLNGLVRAGDKQTFSGAPPFSVFLGNAPGVSVDIGGKPVDLAKYTAENGTARFSLGAGTP